MRKRFTTLSRHVFNVVQHTFSLKSQPSLNFVNFRSRASVSSVVEIFTRSCQEIVYSASKKTNFNET